MRLRQYLEITRLPLRYAGKTQLQPESFYQRCDRFGAELGVTGYCVRKWAYRQRQIKDETKARIEHLTKGQVTLRDLTRGWSYSGPEVQPQHPHDDEHHTALQGAQPAVQRPVPGGA